MPNGDHVNTVREILRTQANEFDHISPELLEQIYELETKHASLEERHEVKSELQIIIEEYKEKNDF